MHCSPNYKVAGSRGGDKSVNCRLFEPAPREQLHSPPLLESAGFGVLSPPLYQVLLWKGFVQLCFCAAALLLHQGSLASLFCILFLDIIFLSLDILTELCILPRITRFISPFFYGQIRWRVAKLFILGKLDPSWTITPASQLFSCKWLFNRQPLYKYRATHRVANRTL